jgi:hypothetical protein
LSRRRCSSSSKYHPLFADPDAVQDALDGALFHPLAGIVVRPRLRRAHYALRVGPSAGDDARDVLATIADGVHDNRRC